MKEVLMGKLAKVTKCQRGKSVLKVVIRVNYLLPSNKKALKSASSYRQIGFFKEKVASYSLGPQTACNFCYF